MTTTAKHSPGPWGPEAALSSDMANIRYINDAEGRIIASVRHRIDQTQDEALANASVFAAASEMLAALEEIEYQLSAHPDAHIGNKLVHFAYHRARSAAAYARGEK